MVTIAQKTPGRSLQELTQQKKEMKRFVLTLLKGLLSIFSSSTYKKKELKRKARHEAENQKIKKPKNQPSRPTKTAEEMKGSIHWIIDNGHGAINPANQKPVTPGKRSPEFPKGHDFEGKVLIEGVRNRKVVEYLSNMLEKEGLKFTNLVDTWKDVDLEDRTDEANEIARSSDIPCVYLSIHHDGFGRGEWNAANGCGPFAKSSKSMQLAKVFAETIPASTGLKSRGAKTANFWVLRKTVCLAVLTENGFMTNLNDASFCITEEGSKKIAKGHFDAIKEIENNFQKYL